MAFKIKTKKNKDRNSTNQRCLSNNSNRNNILKNGIKIIVLNTPKIIVDVINTVFILLFLIKVFFVFSILLITKSRFPKMKVINTIALC